MPADGAWRGVSTKPVLTEDFFEGVEEEIDVGAAGVDVRGDADLGSAEGPDFALGEFGPEGRVVGAVDFESHHAAVEGGIGRGEHLEIRDLGCPAVGVLGEVVDAVVDALGAEFFDEAQSFEDAFEFGTVVAAQLHVLDGVFGILPAVDDDGGPEFRLKVFVDVEDAAAGRGEHPFVQAAGEDVAAKVIDAEGDLTSEVCAVDYRDDAFGAGGGADFLYGEEQAGVGGDAGERNDTGFGADLREQGVGDLIGILRRDGYLGLAHLDAGAGLFEEPAAAAGGMFLIGDEDFVATFEIKTVGDEAHRFGGVVGEGELFFGSAKEFG